MVVEREQRSHCARGAAVTHRLARIGVRLSHPAHEKHQTVASSTHRHHAVCVGNGTRRLVARCVDALLAHAPGSVRSDARLWRAGHRRTPTRRDAIAATLRRAQLGARPRHVSGVARHMRWSRRFVLDKRTSIDDRLALVLVNTSVFVASHRFLF